MNLLHCIIVVFIKIKILKSSEPKKEFQPFFLFTTLIRVSFQDIRLYNKAGNGKYHVKHFQYQALAAFARMVAVRL